MSRSRSPSSSMFAASRSLWHGTVDPRAPSASPHRVDGGQELVVAGRQPEAVLGHDPQVAALHLEHVEVAGEPRARRAAAGRPRRPGPGRRGSRRSASVERAGRQEADGEARRRGGSAAPGAPTPAVGRGHRVGVLGVAVDREQVVRRRCGQPHDAGAVGGGDLEVAVGQPARELLDRAGVARPVGGIASSRRSTSASATPRALGLASGPPEDRKVAVVAELPDRPGS